MPVEEIQIKVLRIRVAGGVVGSWMPTLMGSECCCARDRSPRTKGDVVKGRQRDRDWVGLEAM